MWTNGRAGRIGSRVFLLLYMIPSMKRILIFSLAYEPFVGGAEVAIREITAKCDPAQYEFVMVTLRFDANLPEVERVGNITVHRIGFAVPGAKIADRALPWQCRVAKILFPIASLLKARALHKQKSFDLIWGMMANQAGFGALFFKLLNPHIPYFLELQDGNSLAQVRARRPITRLVWSLYKQIYLKADAIKAISHFIEKLAREVGYEKRIEVIPNGVDMAKFSAPVSEDDLIALKEKYGKGMGDVFLFTASRLVLSRGVEDVIRALAYLPANVKFLIAGDGEDRGKLESIAREARVFDRVIFAGHQTHAQLPALLKVSDIFVRPSIIEGMGNAFIEAFAAEVPVVATPVGGIPDFLFDPEANPDMEPTGIFCKVRDPESVARAVEKYMRDPALTARIVRNAKELAAKRYDWSLIAHDMRTRIFDRLV